MFKLKLRTILLPKKEFLSRAKKLFLAEFERECGKMILRPKFKAVTGILAAIFIFFGIAGGLIAYADTANVNVSHPLYGLKRYGESFRVALAKKTDKPVLHAELAKRRLNEIKSLEATGKTSKKINQTKSLKKEMRESFKNSLETDSEETAQKSCVALSGFVEDDSLHPEKMFTEHSVLLQKFQEKCSPHSKNGEDI